MPMSEKAQAVFDAAKTDARLKPSAFSQALADARSALRDLQLAATELQFQVDDVDDQDERRTGIEEMSQKVGGLLRQIGEATKWLRRCQRTADSIVSKAPIIEARIEERANRGTDA